MTANLTPHASDVDAEEVASALLPTCYGDFRVIVFRERNDAAYGLSAEHIALVKGAVDGKRGVLLRVQSECVTGEVFGSLRCDCRDQLALAQRQIENEGSGVVLYLRQEGRGIGLTNKIKAYALQDQGADTVDANLHLRLPVDARSYDVAATMLRQLRVRSVRLLSNNPDKETSLRLLGIDVEERLPLRVRATQHSARYIATKRERMNHDYGDTDASDAAD